MRIICPGCGKTFRLPADQELVEGADVWLAEGDESRVEPNRKAVKLQTKSDLGPLRKKVCPMCGEEEDAEARRCRFCGETLAGFQDADGYSIDGVWRDGNLLVMTKTALLPGLCVQTNIPTADRLRRRLYWHNPWIYLALLAGPLIFIIVAIITRQSADIKIGLCRERIVRRRWIIAGAWLGVLLGIGMCIAGGASRDSLGTVFWATGLVLFLASMIAGIILARIIVPTKITSRHVWLKGVHPSYLFALPAFPGDE
ncbi:MAG TPA: hypothetical protein VGM05_03195 [Planctomycetaceae bacterium]